MGLLRARRVLYIFLGLYAVTLILLIPAKPLWMDRLPSVLFTVATCAGVYMLASQTRLRMPLLAAVFYAVSPLTVRSALVARPYAQAACWAVFSTVLFLSLIRRPAIEKAAGYALLIAAGLYAQPFSIFVPVAHLVWLGLTGSVKEKPRAMALSGTAVVLALAAFLPWFLQAHAVPQGALNTVTPKDLLVIPRDLMGTGYVGAALAAISIAVALAWSSWIKVEKIFWIAYLAIPLVLAPAADVYFGYVPAAQQLIFVLVPISILLVACMEIRRGWLVPAALLVAMLYADVRWLSESR